MKRLAMLMMFLFGMNAANAEDLFFTKNGLLHSPPEIRIDEKERECLAYNIYHEARNDPYEGMLAVATVTLNRVKSKRYPNTICEVVWQVNKDRRTGKQVAQFSWTLDGKPDRPYNREAYKVALQIAEEVLRYGKHSAIICEDTLNYHAVYVKPFWSSSMRRVARIGNHYFYR